MSTPRFSLRRTEEPEVDAVDFDEAKRKCRIFDNRKDLDLARWIKAATAEAEARLRRALITQTWQLRLDDWPYTDSECNPYREIIVHRPRLQEVTFIKYIDTAGDEQTWDEDNYRVDIYSEPGRIAPEFAVAFPVVQRIPFPITVEYIAGYGDAPSDLPWNVREWILAAVAAIADQPALQLQLDRGQSFATNDFSNNLLAGEMLGDLVVG